MPFVSPQEIEVKAASAYPRFLSQWVRGEHQEFFPLRLRVRLIVDPRDPKGTIAASELLQASSKAERGWGYTVHRKQVRMRDFGNNPVPAAITIDTLDDLLRLTKKADEFAATRLVADRVRTDLPRLNDWLVSHARSIHSIADRVDQLINVAEFFIDHPWPDCYARQIPVPVDTKFIDRNKTILRQWLDLLLPASAMDVNETKFAGRFGLRDGQSHRAIRLLDPQLLDELALRHEELSLPLRSIAELPVKDATAFIVENGLNLLTLPRFHRGIAIRGEGNAVNRLERISWLGANRILYWGDIDVDGFLILSRLRNLFSHVESIIMDRRTMRHHETYIVEGNGSAPAVPTNLTSTEAVAFEFCAANNLRLEQEKILQPFVDQVVEQLGLDSGRR